MSDAEFLQISNFHFRVWQLAAKVCRGVESTLSPHCEMHPHKFKGETQQKGGKGPIMSDNVGT